VNNYPKFCYKLYNQDKVLNLNKKVKYIEYSMLKYIFRFFFVLIITTLSHSITKGQEERKISLSAFGGLALYPKNKNSPAELPTRVLGGFKPSPLVGLGIYYRLSKRLHIGENYSFLLPAKTDFRSLKNHALRTTLKYYILTDRKINPYLTTSINYNILSLNRKENEYSVVPGTISNTDIIGSGILVDSIHYREKSLKLSKMPTMGVSFGVGIDIRLNKKFYFFAEYNINQNAGKKNDLIEKYYFYNKSGFAYHSVSAGITMKLFKPQKQLLATLDRDDWKNSRSIDVKGTIIYKNPAKPYKKILPVEKTDTSETVLGQNPTDEIGVVFFSKDIEPGEYQFMLPKKHRRIIRADLQILNYNKIEIADDELELEMVEDEVSENILSRDANFAVLLREGFQHEIELTTTAENIMGTFTPSDTACKVRIVLKDQFDSVIAYVDTLKDNKFNFVDIEPGNYKITFQRMNNECTQTIFNYSFTGATPYVKKQSNTNEPEDTIESYSINGKISTSQTKPDVPKGTVSKLVDPSGRVVTKTNLAGTKTDFSYKNLNSPDYTAIFEDPTDKASMSYQLKDRKSNIIRQVKIGPAKKPVPSNITVNGKVELPNTDQTKTVSVMLIDSTGKIRNKIPVNSDGSFSFPNLPKNNYKIAYESTDPLVRGKLDYSTTDKSLKITKIILPVLVDEIEAVDTIHFYKKTTDITQPVKDTSIIIKDKTLPVKDTTIAVIKDKTIPKDTSTLVVKDKTLPVKDTAAVAIDKVKKDPKIKEIPVKYSFSEFKPNITYNDLGYEVKPVGYGLQVASFVINSNMEKFCQRLRTKGEKNIFIQVIMKDKNNPDAGLIYRVILGADENGDKVNKKIPSYTDKGYDAVLRKHL
jgi:hypothetical protein